MQSTAMIYEDGTYYELEYIEELNIVLVTKEPIKRDAVPYIVTVKKKGGEIGFVCSCFGYIGWVKGRNREPCRHVKMLKHNSCDLDFTRVVKPRTFINKIREEFYKIRIPSLMERRKR